MFNLFFPGHSWAFRDRYPPTTQQSTGEAGAWNLAVTEKAGEWGGTAPPAHKKSGGTQKLILCCYFSYCFLFTWLFCHVQIQLIETKRQLELQVALHQKTKDLLSAAEMELNALRKHPGSSDAHHSLGPPTTPILRCEYSIHTYVISARYKQRS